MGGETGFTSSIHDFVCSVPTSIETVHQRVTGAMRLGCAGEEQSLTAPFTTISHSLTKMSLRCFFFTLRTGLVLSGALFFFAGGRSQAVVGKSRTTGSIYLTSVSSTIAKHHQRATLILGM